jgi:hypothetical protein
MLILMRFHDDAHMCYADLLTRYWFLNQTISDWQWSHRRLD